MLSSRLFGCAIAIGILLFFSECLSAKESITHADRHCELYEFLNEIVNEKTELKKDLLKQLSASLKDGKYHPHDRLACHSGSLYGYALVSGDPGLVELMLENGASPNAIWAGKKSSDTPLIGVVAAYKKALKNGNPDQIVNLIVAKGGDVNAEVWRNRGGRSYCVSFRREIIRKIFLYRQMCEKSCMECCRVVWSLEDLLGQFLSDKELEECGETLEEFAENLGGASFSKSLLSD